MKKFNKILRENGSVLMWIVVSILFLGVPFMHYQAGWLALVAPLPIIFLLDNIKGLPGKIQMFFIWLAGFASSALVTHWALQTQPERWTAFTGEWAIGLLITGWLMLVISLSAGWWLFGFLWVRLGLTLNDRYIWLTLPALWVLCEYLRSFVFSIVSWGPDTTFGPFWGFGVVGSGVGVTPLGFVARFAGFYGLSVVAVMISMAIYKFIRNHRNIRPLVLVVGISAVATIISFMVYLPSKSATYSISAVQLGVDPSPWTPGVNSFDEFSQKHNANNIDILVMPEYSQSLSSSDTYKALYDKLSPDGVAITSLTEIDNSKHYNQLVAYNRDGKVIDSQRKEFLIPVGESSPYLMMVPLQILGKGSEVQETMRTREVSKGNNPIRLTSVNGYKIGALVCSGAVAPFQYQELVREGADVLTNSASLSIFEKSYTYHQQTQQIARIIAMATNRPFVQSTDGSYSYIIDKDGNYLAKSSQEALDIISANVSVGKHRTIYDFLGEWTILVSIIVLSVVIFGKWYHLGIQKRARRGNSKIGK